MSKDGFKTYRVNSVGLVHELAALMGLALFARASWYTAFHWRSDRRRARGGCPTCGYSREGLDPGAPCPECGTLASLAAGTSRIGSFTSTIVADVDSSPRRESEPP